MPHNIILLVQRDFERLTAKVLLLAKAYTGTHKAAAILLLSSVFYIIGCNPLASSELDSSIKGKVDACWQEKGSTNYRSCDWQLKPADPYLENQIDKTLWFRYRMPENNLNNPVIMLRVTSSIEVYQDDKFIFSHGNIKEPHRNINHGQYVVIDLLNNHDDIFFRVTSSIDQIGIYRNYIVMANFRTMMVHYAWASLQLLSAIIFFMTLSAIVLLVWAMGGLQQTYLFFAALAALSSAFKICNGLAGMLSLLKIDSMPFYIGRHFSYLVYASLFVTFCAFFLSANGIKSRFFKVIASIYMLILVSSIVTWTFSVVSSKDIYEFAIHITQLLNPFAALALLPLILETRSRHLKIFIAAFIVILLADTAHVEAGLNHIIHWNFLQGLALALVLAVSCWYTFNRDRKEKKILEQKYVAYQAMSSTIQMVAHDIARPFQVLRLILHSIAAMRKFSASHIKSYLHRLDCNIIEVDGMLSDLSHLEDGRYNLNCVDFNIIDSIHESLINYYICADRPPVFFSYQFRCNKLVYGDPSKIYRVLHNLIDNASLHTPDNGHIWFASEEKIQDGEHILQFTIGNSGSYVPPDKIGKIFDFSFTSRPHGKSRGLGLAISKKIINEHGGEIWVRSNLDKGTEFIFTLPLSSNVGDASKKLPTKSSDIQLEEILT